MSDVRDTEPRLLKEPRGGVPDVTSTLDGYHRVCDAMAEATGSLAADAERASGFRYGHEDWLIQFKREDAGIALLDPVALTRARSNSPARRPGRQRILGDPAKKIHEILNISI